MNLGIKVEQIEGGDYLAQADWSIGDAGQVGTPGAVKYGETEAEAYDKLKKLLQVKGHTVITKEYSDPLVRSMDEDGGYFQTYSDGRVYGMDE